MTQSLYISLALYPSNFVFVSVQTEINAFKISAASRMVPMNTYRGITVFLQSKFNISFIAAWAPSG